jgi:hypothetical protein
VRRCTLQPQPQPFATATLQPPAPQDAGCIPTSSQACVLPSAAVTAPSLALPCCLSPTAFACRILAPTHFHAQILSAATELAAAQCLAASPGLPTAAGAEPPSPQICAGELQGHGRLLQPPALLQPTGQLWRQ